LRYLSFDKLLEAEAGYSVNEPSQLAVRQAIETAVYSLVMEGALRGMWGFTDPAAGKASVDEYLKRRDQARSETVSMTPDTATVTKPAPKADKAPIKP
jgi:curli production assembly/transport component CsgG